MATKDNTSNTKEYPDKFGRKHDSQEKVDAANAQIDAQCKYLKTKYNGVEEDVALETINILNPDLCIDIEGLTEDEFEAALFEAQVTRSLENKKKEDSAKDKAGLSEDGLRMWIALRLAHQLEWRGDYCWPKEGDIEQKAHVLREILPKLDMEKPLRFSEEDFPVVRKRLGKSLNKINSYLKPIVYEDEEVEPQAGSLKNKKRSNAPEPNAYQELLRRTTRARYAEGKSLNWKMVLDSLKHHLEKGDSLDTTGGKIRLTIAEGTDDKEVIKRKESTFEKDLSFYRQNLLKLPLPSKRG